MQTTVYLILILLTFPGDVSTNPDLQYFQAGDVVQAKNATKMKFVVTTSTNYVVLLRSKFHWF